METSSSPVYSPLSLTKGYGHRFLGNRFEESLSQPEHARNLGVTGGTSGLRIRSCSSMHEIHTACLGGGNAY